MEAGGAILAGDLEALTVANAARAVASYKNCVAASLQAMRSSVEPRKTLSRERPRSSHAKNDDTSRGVFLASRAVGAAGMLLYAIATTFRRLMLNRSDRIIMPVSLNDDIPSHVRASHDTSSVTGLGCGLHPLAAWLQLVEGDILPVVGD